MSKGYHLKQPVMELRGYNKANNITAFFKKKFVIMFDLHQGQMLLDFGQTLDRILIFYISGT